MPLEAAIGQIFAPYCPGGHHVINFGVKNQVVALWKSLFEASVQKARNKPSTQLIEATGCVKMWNITVKAEEHSYLSSYQTLTTDKNH